MRKFINKKSIAALFLSVIVFVYLTNNYDTMFIRNIDEGLLEFLVRNTQPATVFLFEVITIMANWQTIVLGSLILLFLMRDKLMVLLVSAITGLVYLVVETLKMMFERPRPNVMQLTHATGYSMPSGHAVTAMVFYGLIMVFFVSKIEDKRYRRLAQVLLSILILLIAFSRVYLRVHYLSDVLAGLSLGLIIVTIIYNIKVGIFDNITTYLEGEEIE